MRRNALAAALLVLLVLAPAAGQPAEPVAYSLLMAGSRCANALSRADAVFASAWVCTGVQVARTGTAVPDAERFSATNAFGCISIADFRAGVAQRACGPVADGALSGDAALQEGKIDFFLTSGDLVLAARLTLTGVGPYLNDHLFNEFGNAATAPSQQSQLYAVARIYRSAKVGGFIMGSGVGTNVRGARGSLSTGVSGVATIRAEGPPE